MSPDVLEKVRLDILDDLSSCLRSCHDGRTNGIAAFGASTPNELAVRLAGALYVLTRLHDVDDRGRCRVCRPGTSTRLRRLPWPTRKAPCRVLKVVAFFATADEEEIWLRLLPRLGIRMSLNEIRAHLINNAATHDFAGTLPIPAQADQSGRPARQNKHVST